VVLTRHFRAGGNPVGEHNGLDSRLRGNDESVSRLRGNDMQDPIGQPIAGLSEPILAELRAALAAVVSDPQGTAHATVFQHELPIAGKTGTAQSGDGRADHAWFVGYAPAEKPRVAFAIALEHAGDAATAAGPVAARLAQSLQERGYLAE
jgi:penicillin-binding protein 2